MSDGPSARAGGEGVGPSGVAAELDGLAARMEAALKGLGESAARRELAECVGTLRRQSAGLREVAAAFDPQHAQSLARREEELKSIVLATGQSLQSLTRANRQMATRVGCQIREIEAVAALPPGEELVTRLRSAADQVRDAAGQLERELDTSGASIERSNERITALESELEEARRKLLYDGLTRLFGRSALDERLAAAVAAGNRDGPWCFLMADIDGFKGVNDRFGHLVGDALLYKVARVIETALRQRTGEGFLSRYGGDEFAIVLPHATLAQAGDVGERIRREMAGVRWQYRVQGGETVIQATVSIGVAQYRALDTVAGLVGRADSALYRAKSEGRNRVSLETA